MLFASQRIAEFRDRKTKDSKMLINHLKVNLLLACSQFKVLLHPSLSQYLLEYSIIFDISELLGTHDGNSSLLSGLLLCQGIY